MAITRINHFEAKPGQGGDLHRFLALIVETIRKAYGCQSCTLLESLDHVERLVVLEAWDDVDAHQAAAKLIPPTRMQEVMALLASPVTGSYYRSVDP